MSGSIGDQEPKRVIRRQISHQTIYIHSASSEQSQLSEPLFQAGTMNSEPTANSTNAETHTHIYIYILMYITIYSTGNMFFFSVSIAKFCVDGVH